MAPPQLYELERMKLFPTLNQLHHYSRVHGQEVMSCWMPVMKMCTDAFIIVLPGEHKYISGEHRFLPGGATCVDIFQVDIGVI